MLPQADGIYKMDHNVARTWKPILKAFAIDPDYAKRKVKQTGSQPNAGAHTVKIKQGDKSRRQGKEIERFLENPIYRP